MILNAQDGKRLPVYGNGTNVRDWLYVRDHSTAIWKIITNGKRGETYNIGSRSEMKNIDVVGMICDLVDKLAGIRKGYGNRRNLISFTKDRPGHDWRYAIDPSKLEQELGWTPTESFESGLRKTIIWYFDHPNWVNTVRSGKYLNWIKEQYGGV